MGGALLVEAEGATSGASFGTFFARSKQTTFGETRRRRNAATRNRATTRSSRRGAKRPRRATRRDRTPRADLTRDALLERERVEAGREQ